MVVAATSDQLAGPSDIRSDPTDELDAMFRQIVTVRADERSSRADLDTALRSIARLQSWLAASKAVVTDRLATHVSFPESAISDCTRGSSRDEARDRSRAETLGRSGSLAAALDHGDITPAHVDELTRASGRLEPGQRHELFDRLDQGLLHIAANSNVDQWRKHLDLQVRTIQRSDGMDRLERQRRNTRLRTWTDDDGMWCMTAKLDPVNGVALANRLHQTVEALFAGATPNTCPADPVEKHHHLQALALIHLVTNGTGTGRPARPDITVVIDTTTVAGDAAGPTIDWGLPIEIPHQVLAELTTDTTVHPVVVRNGVILHAPGTLDLGRTTRLANRAQRRALRALYPTCAIPGCTTPFQYCHIHHIIWWRHGGRTDLDNLIPVCSHHHTLIHTAGWQLALAPDRTLTITYPDDTTRTSRPTRHSPPTPPRAPPRRAAA